MHSSLLFVALLSALLFLNLGTANENKAKNERYVVTTLNCSLLKTIVIGIIIETEESIFAVVYVYCSNLTAFILQKLTQNEKPI